MRRPRIRIAKLALLALIAFTGLTGVSAHGAEGVPEDLSTLVVPPAGYETTTVPNVPSGALTKDQLVDLLNQNSEADFEADVFVRGYSAWFRNPATSQVISILLMEASIPVDPAAFIEGFNDDARSNGVTEFWQVPGVSASSGHTVAVPEAQGIARVVAVIKGPIVALITLVGASPQISEAQSIANSQFERLAAIPAFSAKEEARDAGLAMVLAAFFLLVLLAGIVLVILLVRKSRRRGVAATPVFAPAAADSPFAAPAGSEFPAPTPPIQAPAYAAPSYEDPQPAAPLGQPQPAPPYSQPQPAPYQPEPAQPLGQPRSPSPPAAPPTQRAPHEDPRPASKDIIPERRRR